jgi:hypothetical protein
MWNPLQKFFDTNQYRNELQALHAHADALTITTQAAINAMTGLDESSEVNYVGSRYRTYDAQVNELSRKYAGIADWGSLVMKNIIDVRAAFITGAGVVPRVREGYTKDAKRELEFIRRFMRMNGIDGRKPQVWGAEAEIEGKILLRIVPNLDPLDGQGNVHVVHTPWRQYKYNVTAAEPDFDRYIRAEHTGSSPATSFDLAEPYFIYARFGGNTHEINLTPPKAAFVLRQVEDLDKELWDWRKINHLFAAPTPWFDCEDPDEARRLSAYISEKNWRIGKAIVTAQTKFELVSFKGEGSDSIKKAIESDVQVISGTTGIPVHFLGHPELLSNRSTADALLQHIELSTDKERDIWESAYTELFRKAVAVYNEGWHNSLDPDAVVADLPSSSAENLTNIEKVYLPMYIAGALSLDTLLSKLKDVNLAEELVRVREMQKEKEEKAAADLEAQAKIAMESKNAAMDKSRNTGNGGK